MKLALAWKAFSGICTIAEAILAVRDRMGASHAREYEDLTAEAEQERARQREGRTERKMRKKG